MRIATISIMLIMLHLRVTEYNMYDALDLTSLKTMILGRDSFRFYPDNEYDRKLLMKSI